MSGHWDVYRENMYFTEVEGRSMGLKPMNCPAHIQLYNDERRSYRDLPIRYSEQGLVHRHEPSGTLHGLLRVRHITQDDAHIFCTEEQIPEEVNRCLDFGYAIYDTFGFEPRLELSTRPAKRIGSEEMWDRAEAALQSALDQRGVEYDLNEGDGAFYGPKIDLHMTDTIGRSWQLGTVQLDYNMPERFELAYTGADNADHRPVMIHRALMGSFERFIGILIEHYAGEFPLWLAPVQARVLPLADRHADYAARGRGGARRGRPARGARRPHRVGRAQDPRGGAAQGALHARRRRPRGRAARRRAAPPPRGRPRARCRSTRPSRAWRPRSAETQGLTLGTPRHRAADRGARARGLLRAVAAAPQPARAARHLGRLRGRSAPWRGPGPRSPVMRLANRIEGGEPAARAVLVGAGALATLAELSASPVSGVALAGTVARVGGICALVGAVAPVRDRSAPLEDPRTAAAALAIGAAAFAGWRQLAKRAGPRRCASSSTRPRRGSRRSAAATAACSRARRWTSRARASSAPRPPGCRRTRSACSPACAPRTPSRSAAGWRSPSSSAWAPWTARGSSSAPPRCAAT